MRRLVVLAALVAAPFALPATADAAASGSATLEISLATANALESRGVSVSVTAPAERSARTVVVPVRSVSVGKTATLGVGGTVRLRRGKHSVTLSTLQIVLGARSSITAVVAGKRLTVWTLAPTATALGLDAGSASARLVATKATLTQGAAVLLRRKLGGKALPRTSFLRLAADAAGDAPPRPVVPPTVVAPSCRTLSDGGTPANTGTGEPSVKGRPATAIDVTGATITWHPRESFVRYIATGEGTTAADGATGDAPEVRPGTDTPLTYSFHFPFARGWCDPATGKAAIYGTGSVAFHYKDHGIDLVVNDPEVEIDGSSSRVIFRMTGSGDTNGGNRRQVVETLDPAKAASISTSADAKTFTYQQLPGTVPAGADSSVFAGYYLPGDEFGWLSVSFTTV